MFMEFVNISWPYFDSSVSTFSKCNLLSEVRLISDTVYLELKYSSYDT